jgi:hypothetical protein
MQGHAEREAEFSVQSELLKSEKVLANVLGEITAHELLTAIVEGASSIGTSIVHSWSKKLCII